MIFLQWKFGKNRTFRAEKGGGLLSKKNIHIVNHRSLILSSTRTNTLNSKGA